MRAREQSGRSMNAEILARLSLTFAPDPALRVAEVLRPLLSPLSERDQAKVVEAVEILSKGQRKKAKNRASSAL